MTVRVVHSFVKHNKMSSLLQKKVKKVLNSLTQSTKEKEHETKNYDDQKQETCFRCKQKDNICVPNQIDVCSTKTYDDLKKIWDPLGDENTEATNRICYSSECHKCDKEREK